MPCCHEASVAPSLWAAFTGGLVGGLHCLGMCGPLVAVVESSRAAGAGPWAPLPLHLGRVTTYVVLGGVAGAAGAGLDQAGLALGIQGFASGAAGFLMLVAAAGLAGLRPLRRATVVGDGVVPRFVRALAAAGPGRSLVLGLWWGLLPCGLVWAFLAQAASTGSPGRGALSMALFGAGTVPSLLLSGGLLGLLGSRWRARLPRISAALVGLLGILLVLRALAFAGWVPHLHLARGWSLY